MSWNAGGCGESLLSKPSVSLLFESEEWGHEGVVVEREMAWLF